jgi:hypothetical protein
VGNNMRNRGLGISMMRRRLGDYKYKRRLGVIIKKHLILSDKILCNE